MLKASLQTGNTGRLEATNAVVSLTVPRLDFPPLHLSLQSTSEASARPQQRRLALARPRKPESPYQRGGQRQELCCVAAKARR